MKWGVIHNHLKARVRDDAVNEGRPPPPLRVRHPTTAVGSAYPTETAAETAAADAGYKAWRASKAKKDIEYAERAAWQTSIKAEPLFALDARQEGRQDGPRPGEVDL